MKPFLGRWDGATGAPRTYISWQYLLVMADDRDSALAKLYDHVYARFGDEHVINNVEILETIEWATHPPKSSR